MLSFRRWSFLLVLLASVMSPGASSPATAGDYRTGDHRTGDHRTGDQLANWIAGGLPPEVRLRKMHLVRPDLIPYPIAIEVYC